MRAMMFAAAVLSAIVGALAWRVQTLRTALDRAQAETREINRAYQTLAEQYQAADDAYQALIASQAQVRERHQPAVRRVQSAKPSDDASLAPVLRQALEDLQP
ncbi:MAG: hypothetical protein Q4A06_02455 [Cardiobacteriaceae bacterium]|nr:hypothetical protein [Cardiobacteriaceae bacterium]